MVEKGTEHSASNAQHDTLKVFSKLFDAVPVHALHASKAQSFLTHKDASQGTLETKGNPGSRNISGH